MEKLQKAAPLLGDSQAIQSLREFIVGVSLLSDPALISGPSGVGKSLAARKIHAIGRTARAPFVNIACNRFETAELTNLLFEGVGSSHPGLLNSKIGGSCYLSRMECMAPSLVRKLAKHWIQQGPESEAPRILLGSRFSLDDLRRRELLDSSLLDIVSNYHMWIPPLRDRVEDIPVLCNYQLWIQCGSEEYEHSWDSFCERILPDLLKHNWPGNVSELNGMVSKYCSDSNSVNAEESGPNADAQFLSEEFSEMMQELQVLLEIEDLCGRSDLVLGSECRFEEEKLQDHAH